MGTSEDNAPSLKKRRSLSFEEGLKTCPSKRKFQLEGANVLNNNCNGHIMLRSTNLKDVKPGIHLSAHQFKDIVYNCFYEDFQQSYNKINCRGITGCCDKDLCDSKHKNIARKEMSTFNNGTFFSILDNSFSNWIYDLSTAAFTVLRPEIYFRSDVLCILFDYLLNGPDENLVWDIKHIISSHIELHPPCTEPMREFYLKLLSRPCAESYFSRTDLTKNGVFNFLIKELEDSIGLFKPFEEEEMLKSSLEESVSDWETSKGPDCLVKPLTYNLLAERHNKFEPLLDNEYNEVQDALKDNENGNQVEEQLVNKVKIKRMPRLSIAVELISDLLEADFLIWVSELKRSIAAGTPNKTPANKLLVNHLMNESLHHTIFQLYSNTSDQPMWIQLSRLIAVMAECERMYRVPVDGIWNFPTSQIQCDNFTTALCHAISNCGKWGDDERLLRLNMMQPPWLRLRVAMYWLDIHLNIGVNSGNDLETLVDIIHMHITNPVQMEKDTHCKVTVVGANTQSSDFVKKALKRNKYGETMLHRLCRRKTGSMSKLFSLLAIPDVDVNAKDYNGWTPLHEAVISQSLLKVKALLNYQPPPGKSRVKVTVQNNDGYTPLHEAVHVNNLEICNLLVEHGGTCLLRKTDVNNVTPKQMAKENPEISRYFDTVIKAQEALNLNSNSVLNMSENIVQLLILACETFLDDNLTLKVYNAIKFTTVHITGDPKNWIVVNSKALQKLKCDQELFRKLRKIVCKLSENPANSHIIRLWNSRFQNIVEKCI